MPLPDATSFRTPALAILLLYAGGLAQTVTSQQHQRARTSKSDGAPYSSPDIQHPATFVSVLEETSARHHYCVFRPGDTLSTYCSFDAHSNNPAAEIDPRSRIHIRFDRTLIMSRRGVLNGDITVSGFLSKKDGSQPPVQIPGYSEIGQQAKIASVRIRTGVELLNTLAEIANLSATLRARMDSISREVLIEQGPASQTGDSTNLTDLQPLLSQLRRAHDSVEVQAREVIRVRREHVSSLGTQPDDSIRLAVDTSNKKLLALQIQWIEYGDSLARLDQEAARRAARIAAASDAKVLDAVRDTTARRKRRALLSAEGVLTVMLTKVVSFDDSSTFNHAARVVRADPDVLRQHANEILKLHYPSVTDTTRGASAIEGAVTEVLNDLERLERLSRELNDPRGGVAAAADSLAQMLVAQLKDTNILVGETGAEPGDYLTIVVSSKQSEADLPRQLRVRMLVRRFGLVQRTSDSFLFLKRVGIPPPLAGSADSVPAPYNYVPTAGVTFGWSLEYRRQWGPPVLTTIVRWIEPGFGLNVSFPRFGTQIRSFEAGDPGQVTIQEVEGDRFDLALGGVLTLFGGAVQLTYGRNLTVSKDKGYWGIGFSFIQVISEVRERVGDSD